MNKPAQINLEDFDCPLCCSNNDEALFTGRDLLHDLPGEYTVVKCRTCGLMRTNPRPTPETIGFYYPDNYGPYRGTRVSISKPTRAGLVKKLLRPLVKRIFDFKTAPLPATRPGRMLEIGCASGGFLHQMAQTGWQVEGIEFSKKAAQAASQLGYRVHAGPLETAPSPTEPFDLIVGWMVLEHLHDPINGLKKLHAWAKPGAWLVVSVPNAGALEFRIFKTRWYALQLPTHLYHYTPRTIRLVLERCGYSVEKIYHQRILSNLIASTGYLFRDKGFVALGRSLIDFPERSGPWHYLLYPLAWLLSFFGQTGRMTVWARVVK